ncbi:MAG: hypothetical protein C1943_11365 [Halochromatium sp.]|nr:hypothetical protein [Halochromatium sp.]
MAKNTIARSEPTPWFRHLLVAGLLGCLIWSGALVAQISPSEQAVRQVQQMYVAYYGRPGDPAGVDFWAEQVDAAGGAWIPAIIDQFGSSQEYIDRYSALSDPELIENLFLSLFNRSVDPDGMGYYVDLLNGSNLSGLNPEMRLSTLAEIALDVANGAATGGVDRLTLDNKISVSIEFTDAIRASMRPYQAGQIPAAVALLSGVGADAASVAEAEIGILAIARMLNDTGVLTCANSTATDLPCPIADYPVQDGDHGRDVLFPSSAGTGFSFTKLDNAGNELPADANDWVCVRDNATGAVWEVKTDDGGLRDRDSTYTWFESATTSGVGAEDGGSCARDFGTGCDTEKYVADVNALAGGLCGRSNWRLPAPQELAGIIHYGKSVDPLIDTTYFNATPSTSFWTSEADAVLGAVSNQAWSVDFVTGRIASVAAGTASAIRLVSNGQLNPSLYDNANSTITDTHTELTWTQCTLDQEQNDCSVSTQPNPMTWVQALDLARDVDLQGHLDWRLPTLKELLSLVDYTSTNAVIDPAVFTSQTLQQAPIYWTSTPVSGSEPKAWVFDLGTGELTERSLTESAYVRLVRGGKLPVAIVNDECRPDGTGCFGVTENGRYIDREEELSGAISEAIRLLEGDFYVYSSPTFESIWGCSQDPWDIGVVWNGLAPSLCYNQSLLNRTLAIRLRVVDGIVPRNAVLVQHINQGSHHAAWNYALATEPYDLDQPRPDNVEACERFHQAASVSFQEGGCPLMVDSPGASGVRNLYLLIKPVGQLASQCGTIVDGSLYRCLAYVNAW